MKTHHNFIRSLVLTMAVILIISMAAGCANSAAPTEPIETEAASRETAAPQTESPTEQASVTESGTEPVGTTEASTEPSNSAEPGTEPELEPTVQPSETAEPATEPATEPPAQPTATTTPSTVNTEPTEHTHSFESKVTPPTCTAKGYTTYTCKICGYSYTGNETAATGHSYQDTVIAPTCTAEGCTLHKCTVCGYSFTDSSTAATGHTWSQWATVTEPTYTSEGEEQRICTVCGATESQQIARLVMTASQMEQEVFRLVNEEREKAGVAPLQYFSAGQAAADIRVKEIQESFSHTRPDGRSCFSVLTDLSLKYMCAGENIANGFTSPESVMKAWMSSEGHSANILSGSYTGIIIGYENYHWVQIFIG